MANLAEMQEQLARLLMDRISLDEFQDWFAPYSRNIHKQADSAAQEFAYDIQHALAEYNDSPELRDRLMKIILDSLMGQVAAENVSGDPVPPSKAEPTVKSGANCVAA
jgi:hypothetical protein